MKRSDGLLAVAAGMSLACAGQLSPASAQAVAGQAFPNQPVRTINVMGAGGTSDIFVRALGDELAKRWGQPVVAENRPGGGTTIGARACATAPKDGHTLCIFPIETISYNPILMKSPGYDADRDFEPITLAFFNPQVLVVNAKLGVSSLADLARLSKERPGTLSYFSASTAMQVFMRRWNAATGADVVWVVTKSGAEAVNGVLSGSTPIAFFGALNFLQYIENGSVKALAIDGDRRLASLPDVPSLDELGYKERWPRVWFGLFAPGGTPQPVVERVYRDIAAVGNDPDFRKRRLIDLALEPVFSTPEAFARYLKEDRALTKALVQEAGSKPN